MNSDELEQIDSSSSNTMIQERKINEIYELDL